MTWDQKSGDPTQWEENAQDAGERKTQYDNGVSSLESNHSDQKRTENSGRFVSKKNYRLLLHLNDLCFFWRFWAWRGTYTSKRTEKSMRCQAAQTSNSVYKTCISVDCV